MPFVSVEPVRQTGAFSPSKQEISREQATTAGYVEYRLTAPGVGFLSKRSTEVQTDLEHSAEETAALRCEPKQHPYAVSISNQWEHT